MSSAPNNSIPVYIRIRPTSNFASSNIAKTSATSLQLTFPTNTSANKKSSYSFQFSKVLPIEIAQQDVYEECCANVIESALRGYNGTIFAYGQTGAGKTYTISGPDSSYAHRGMIPRAVEHVFRQIHAQTEKSFTVRISYLEIYNEHLYDLLNLDASDAATNAHQEMQILESERGVFVRNLKEEIVENEEEAMSLFFEGEANRSICEHQLNTQSSRSHCVFTIHLECRSRVESEGKVIFSKINLVDMAGSERVSKTGSSGQVLQEAKYINKSLTFLEQVVIALSSPNRDHIPYRQSKLTSILRDAMGGNCLTAMIANIWGEAAHLEETSSTLKFASRMMRVKNQAHMNVHLNPEALIRQYEKQIKDLKQELAMHDQLKGINQVSYDPYTEEQKIQVREQCMRFVDGDIDELEIKNIRQIRETFNQFKTIVLNMRSDMQSGYVPQANGGAAQNEQAAASDAQTANGKKGVGEQQEKDGFSVGNAQPNTKFSGKQKVKKNADSQSQQQEGANSTTGDSERMPRDHAYEKFKVEEGKETYSILKQNMDQYKEKKKAYKDIGKAINESKKQIDEIKSQLDKKQLTKSYQSAQDGDIVDQEEHMLINSLSDAKKEYRANYDQRKLIKNELEYVRNLIDKARARLLDEFDAWYTQKFGPEPTPDALSSQHEEEDEILDDGEKFERLEQERMEDPMSLAYHNARKRVGTLRKTNRRR